MLIHYSRSIKEVRWVRIRHVLTCEAAHFILKPLIEYMLYILHKFSQEISIIHLINYLLLSAFLAFIPTFSIAEIYKCQTNGRVSYTSSPCPKEATSALVKIDEGANKNKKIDGYVSYNDQRMQIKDALALREVRDERVEIHLILYSFKLTDQDLNKIRDFKGHALSPRHDKSRNPSSDLWEVTPIVEFQFVLKDSKRPISIKNIRHWRFVSWMKEVPTTLNNKESTLVKHIQLIRSSSINGQPETQLRTRSGQKFINTQYRWDVSVNVPEIIPRR